MAINYKITMAENDFDFSFPDEIRVNQDFNVRIHSNIEKKCDIKITVEENKEILSEIFFEDKWRSSFYYLKKAYPEKEIFKIRLKNYTKSGELCVKIRETEKQKIIFEKCKKINIVENKMNVTKNKSDKKEKEQLKKTKDEINLDKDEAIKEEQTIEFIEKRTILNPKKVEKNYIKTKAGLIREIIFFGFLFILVIIITLVILKKH